MLSQLIRSFACILKVAGSTPCSSFFFIFFYPDVGTRVSGTSGRSTWNDQSFDLLSSKLMLINRCHFGKITTFSLELRIRRVTSRFEANEPNFCLTSKYPSKPKWVDLHLPLGEPFHERCFLLYLGWTHFRLLASFLQRLWNSKINDRSAKTSNKYTILQKGVKPTKHNGNEPNSRNS